MNRVPLLFLVLMLLPPTASAQGDFAGVWERDDGRRLYIKVEPGQVLFYDRLTPPSESTKKDWISHPLDGKKTTTPDGVSYWAELKGPTLVLRNTTKVTAERQLALSNGNKTLTVTTASMMGPQVKAYRRVEP